MNAAKIKKANEIFQLAVELPVQERASFLTTNCAGDADLQAFVEQLLSHDAAGMGEFMCRPVFTPTADQTQDPEQYVLEAGTKLGFYEIISPLGKGGMGEVWRPRDTKLDREVAIKVLPESMARDPERVAVQAPDTCPLSEKLREALRGSDSVEEACGTGERKFR